MGKQLLKFGTISQAFDADSRTTAGTQYNGAATGAGIDTLGYERAAILVNAGTFAGDGVVTFTATGYTADTATSSSLITGASFSAINSGNDNLAYTGEIKISDQNRYLFVKAVKTGTGAADYGVHVVLYNPQAVAVSTSATNSLVFDV